MILQHKMDPTTIQLDPPGGSENFHGDWQSGAGKF